MYIYLDKIPPGTNIFDGKKVFIFGQPYIYYENPEELKNVLRKYGATVQEQVDDDTDIVIASHWLDIKTWGPFPKYPEDRTDTLGEDELYTVLYNLGERRSKSGKLLKKKPEIYNLWFLSKLEEKKQEAKNNWYSYPSFEDKNVFIHGLINKHKKTVIRLLEKRGGFLVDQFDDDTDIVVIGKNFSLEFIARMEEIRKQRRLIIIDAETFFYQFKVLDEYEKGVLETTRDSEELDWLCLDKNEREYASKLYKKGKADKALEVYEKLLTANEKKYEYWMNIAYFHENLGEPGKAIDALIHYLDAYHKVFPPQIGVVDEHRDYIYKRIAKLLPKMEKNKPKPEPVVKKRKSRAKTRKRSSKRTA